MRKIDTHVHVGVLGDDPGYRRYGRISEAMRHQPVYRIMLACAGIPRDRASDVVFRDAVVEAVASSGLDHVVCLAVDPVYDREGRRREDLSNMWVDNDYVLDVLAPRLDGKALLGASVHPYDPMFRERVARYVGAGAVLLKWIPSAQQIDLADPRVRSALEFLATARPGGKPLPLLLHVGSEYSIVSTDRRTMSYDFLSWDLRDRVRNLIYRWHTPDIKAVEQNLHAGLDAGARVIFAHCGLPYFATWFPGLLEHSDFESVRGYLERYQGQCFADVSACVTPFRQGRFSDIRGLPPGSLLVGSDFPVPTFRLSAGLVKNVRDFMLIVLGQKIPSQRRNPLVTNWRELRRAFGAHPMFHNAEGLFFGNNGT